MGFSLSHGRKPKVVQVKAKSTADTEFHTPKEQLADRGWDTKIWRHINHYALNRRRPPFTHLMKDIVTRYDDNTGP